MYVLRYSCLARMVSHESHFILMGLNCAQFSELVLSFFKKGYSPRKILYQVNFFTFISILINAII